MARKPTRNPRGSSRSKGSSGKNSSPGRLRTPNAWRVVGVRVIYRRSPSGRITKRYVPQVRISGEWLARIGFPAGTRFLMSADREAGILYLQVAARQ